MAKKLMLVGITFLVVAIGIFISMRRSHMMGAGAQNATGGLTAVSSDGKPVQVPQGAGQLPENSAIQESGGLLVTLALSPYPPSASRTSDFDVILSDTGGQPISDAVISLDLTMPSMWMPPNALTMESGTDGKYHATGRFTMRGMWRIEVIIIRGTEKQSVFFDVGL